MSSIQELDSKVSIRLLDRIGNWKSGICPRGDLARQPCFVFASTPHIYIHPEKLISKPISNRFTTEQKWEERLVDCGAIENLSDKSLLKTLADFYMMFYAPYDSRSNLNTLHSLHLQKHASFKVDGISGPTKLLYDELYKMIGCSTLDEKWNKLLDIWTEYGYFWPRKIVLGYKIHLKESYSFHSLAENTSNFYNCLSKVKGRYDVMAKRLDFDLESFLRNAKVVLRQDLIPIHHLLDKHLFAEVQKVIQLKFVKVPAHRPVRLFNTAESSYLCWHPHVFLEQQKDLFYTKKTVKHIVSAVSGDTNKASSTMPQLQYLWRFAWTHTASVNTKAIQISHVNPMDHRTKNVCGSDRVFIYPACKTPLPNSESAKTHPSPVEKTNTASIDDPTMSNTHETLLSCKPYRHYGGDFDRLSRLRPLQFLENAEKYAGAQKIDWTVEYPYNQLKDLTHDQVYQECNLHQRLKNIKPILVGDVVQFQQVGFMSVFTNMEKPVVEEEEEGKEEIVIAATSKAVEKQEKLAESPTSGPAIRKPVYCVEEDLLGGTMIDNTYWKIELADKDDLERHYKCLANWPPSEVVTETRNLSRRLDLVDKDLETKVSKCLYTERPSSFEPETASSFDIETAPSITSTITTSLRKVRSLNSLHDNTRKDLDKFHNYEDLVRSKSTAKWIPNFVKEAAILQLMKPSRPTKHKK